MEASEDGSEAGSILGVIAAESAAFWEKDYDAWARCWVHAAYIRRVGWWARGGVTVIEGWEALSARMRRTMQASPQPNPSAANVRRTNINLRTSPGMAWVTFDQYGDDTGDPAMDMPGRSRETRILEQHDGAWKLVYVGWILEEVPHDAAEQ